MNKGFLSLVFIVFVGVCILLATVIMQFSRKSEGVNSSITALENQVHLLTQRVAAIESPQSAKENALEMKIDSLLQEVTRLEEFYKVFEQKSSLLDSMSIANSRIVEAESAVDSLRELLSPLVPAQIRSKRVVDAQKKILKKRSGLTLVSVAELRQAYKDNDVAAKYHYGSKFVLLSGVVSTVKEFIGLKIVLQSRDRRSVITCQFPQSYRKNLIHIKKGDEIIVKGKYSGSGVFKECSLFE